MPEVPAKHGNNTLVDSCMALHVWHCDCVIQTTVVHAYECRVLNMPKGL